MPPVTIEKFELLPGQGPSQAQRDKPADAQKKGAATSPPSRHELLSTVRQELSRLARVHAH